MKDLNPSNSFRLGLCCLFRDEAIKFKTTTVAYMGRLQAKGTSTLNYLAHLILDNLNALEAAIIYCTNNGIGCFRINSRLLPLYTHSEYGYHLEDLESHELILQAFKKCKALANKNNIRLAFHPDQFVVLNSPQLSVLNNSIEELEYHGVMSDLLGADVINIHAGGVYGDKKLALERFINNFPLLSPTVQKKLTIENDDRCYTPQDLLPVCHELGIPLVYDAHHHACLSDDLSIEQASQLAYQTWNREPLFHISSPLGGWSSSKPQLHADYINIEDFPVCWNKLLPLTVEVEAKAKELAVKSLQKDLSTFCGLQQFGAPKRPGR